MTTTIKDFGRHSKEFGDIGFYYAFNIKFWFGQSMIAPDDVLTWCRENCKGYYKVVCYTSNRSVRNDDGTYETKILYVDKIYLASEDDAAMIKLTFDVRDQQVKRENKIERKPRKTKKFNSGAPVARKGKGKKAEPVQLALFN